MYIFLPFPHYAALHHRNLKTEVSLWKRIKYFPPTINAPEEFENTTSNTVIFDLWSWKPRVDPGLRGFLDVSLLLIFLRFRELRENREAVNTRKTTGTRVPRIRIGKSHYHRATAIVSKSSVFKMFSVHTKTQSPRFQISPVCKALL